MTIEEHMKTWRKKEPWLYSRKVFNKHVYHAIFGAIIGLAVAALAAFPLVHNLAGILLGYFLAQFIFQFGHMTTHALYIENPVEDWEPGVLVAYKHHYENPKAIYEHSLEHRLNFIMQTKGCAVAYLAAWIVPVALFGGSIGLLYVWYLFWFAMVEPVHEYYHVPQKERRERFSLPMLYWLRSL